MAAHAAHSHAEQYGRAGIRARFAHDIRYGVNYALSAFGRREHTHASHVLAARAFGEECDIQPAAAHEIVVNDGRRIVAGIYARQRVGNGFARFAVTAAHAADQRFGKVAVKRRFGSDADEQHRHARILAGIAVSRFRDTRVFEYLTERPFRTLVRFFALRRFEHAYRVRIDFF